MLGNYLIGLREGLEAALVVSILIAYVVKTGRKDLLWRIWAGVGLAVAVSLAFGALLTFGPQGLSEEAQEVIAGVLSLVAVGLVTWMIFWMARSARGLSAELRRQVDSAADSSRWALAIVAMVAVGREGLETALFLWAATQAAASGGSSSSQPLLGALLGLATAVLLGWLIYQGSLKINLTKFFTWTGAFLIVVAAGVLSYGIHELQEGGILPGADTLLFDVSSTIVPDTWYATLLKGVFNFSPTTAVLPAIAWLVYLVPTLVVFLRRIGRPTSTPKSETPAPVTV